MWRPELHRARFSLNVRDAVIEELVPQFLRERGRVPRRYVTRGAEMAIRSKQYSRFAYFARRLALLSVITSVLLCSLLFAEPPAEIFQVSTLETLSLGVFQGSVRFSELRGRGDFGLGTVDGLDGEFVALDGRFHQIRADGAVTPVENSSTTPFAAVTNFHADRTAQMRGPAQVLAAIDQVLESPNYSYAVKIHGDFISVTPRSVPKQIPPYPTLAEAVAKQSVFPLQNVRGTLVGFRSPAFVNGINQPGYHFHFIADDSQAGGHALDFDRLDATIDIEVLRRQSTLLPDNEAFRVAPLP